MKSFVVTNRTFLMLAVFAAIGFSGIALAQHVQHTERPGEGDPAVPAGHHREAGWEGRPVPRCSK